MEDNRFGSSSWVWVARRGLVNPSGYADVDGSSPLSRFRGEYGLLRSSRKKLLHQLGFELLGSAGYYAPRQTMDDSDIVLKLRLNIG